MSRDLDKLVAEMVFGIDTAWYIHSNGARRLVRKGYENNSWNAASVEADVPDYSTNPSAVLDVIRKVVSELGSIELSFNGLTWMARFSNAPGFGESQDLCSAICYAALARKAKEIEV